MRLTSSWPFYLFFGLVSGCSGETALPGGTGDLAGMPAADLSSDPVLDSAALVDLTAAPSDMSGFCGNQGSGRIKLNGMEALTPSVSASPVVLNCCDAGTIDFISMQIAQPISLAWQRFGRLVDPPVTLDLANLPKGWTVGIWSGCSPSTPNCMPTDQAVSGIAALRGSLTITGQNGKYQVTACVEYNEVPGKPHPVIHEVHLWTPTIGQK